MEFKKFQLKLNLDHSKQKSLYRINAPQNLRINKNQKNNNYLRVRVTRLTNTQALEKIQNSLKIKFIEINQNAEEPIHILDSKHNTPQVKKPYLLQFPAGRKLTPRNKDKNHKNTLQVKYEQLVDKIQKEMPFLKLQSTVNSFNKIKDNQGQNQLQKRLITPEKKNQIDPYTKKQYRHVKMSFVNNWNKKNQNNMNRLKNISKPCKINSISLSYRCSKSKQKEKLSSFTFNDRKNRPFSSCQYKKLEQQKRRRQLRKSSDDTFLTELQPWQQIKDQSQSNF